MYARTNSHIKKFSQEDKEDEYKVDMGDKVDHWFKKYGTAVLNDTLQYRYD